MILRKIINFKNLFLLLCVLLMSLQFFHETNGKISKRELVNVLEEEDGIGQKIADKTISFLYNNNYVVYKDKSMILGLCFILGLTGIIFISNSNQEHILHTTEEGLEDVLDGVDAIQKQHTLEVADKYGKKIH